MFNWEKTQRNSKEKFTTNCAQGHFLTDANICHNFDGMFSVLLSQTFWVQITIDSILGKKRQHLKTVWARPINGTSNRNYVTQEYFLSQNWSSADTNKVTELVSIRKRVFFFNLNMTIVILVTWNEGPKGTGKVFHHLIILEVD